MKRPIDNHPALRTIVSNPELLRAELCRRDFYYFVQEFWDTIITEEPVWNWHMQYICQEMEKTFVTVINRQEKEYDLVINISPGTSKSTICTVMFNAWVWIARNPLQAKRKQKDGKEIDWTGADLRFMTGSYNQALSLEHAELTRDLIWSAKYKRYFPELEIRPDKSMKSNFKNTNNGTRFSTAVGATGTGLHAHFIIIDDPVNPKQSLSDLDRASANRWMDQTLSTRKVDKKVTVTILIMQRLHKDDPTGNMVQKSTKLKHIILPANTEYEIKPPSLKKFYKNGLMDPIRLDNTVLKENKKKLLSYGYAGQFGQSPKPREGAMFDENYFEIVNAVPEGGTVWVRGWDLAATTDQESKSNSGPAYTAGVLIKQGPDGLYYIGHAKHFRNTPEGVRKAIRNTASQDPIGTIIDIPQDPGQAGKSQVKSFVTYLPEYNVKYSTESGDKVLRAEPLSAQCEAGNVKILKGNWNTEFLDEIGFFPNGFKDFVDAMSRAYSRVIKVAKMGQGTVGGCAGVPNQRESN